MFSQIAKWMNENRELGDWSWILLLGAYVQAVTVWPVSREEGTVIMVDNCNFQHSVCCWCVQPRTWSTLKPTMFLWSVCGTFVWILLSYKVVRPTVISNGSLDSSFWAIMISVFSHWMCIVVRLCCTCTCMQCHTLSFLNNAWPAPYFQVKVLYIFSIMIIALQWNLS